VAVVIRLARLGQHKSPSYRIVACDKQQKRDGRFLEVVGTYNPLVSPARVTLKEDLIKKWVALGAKPTEVVRSLIVKAIPGFIEGKEEHQKKKTVETRQKRKARASASGKTAAPKAAAPKKAASKKAAPEKK
jgi:small subunit ribosomal protein S16